MSSNEIKNYQKKKQFNYFYKPMFRVVSAAYIFYLTIYTIERL